MTVRLLIGLAVLSLGCSDERYHWVDVPYCQVPAGSSGGHFEANLRVLMHHDNGGGVSTLHGMRPRRGVVFGDDVVVAVVECESMELLRDVQRDVATALEPMDEEELPVICRGQHTVVPPTRVMTQPTDQRGYDGALPFPRVPERYLRCTAGTVALGDSP